MSVILRRLACFSAVFMVAALLAAPAGRAQTAPESAPSRLTVEDIFAHGPIGGAPPQGVAWSPDGEHLSYLDGGELVDLDPLTGKSRVLVSRAKLASLGNGSAAEKDRDHRARYGMASYLWAPDSAHLLFDSNGSLWLYDLKTGTGFNIGSGGAASGDDPKFSPDGRQVSFLKDHTLAVIHLREANTPTSLVLPQSKEHPSFFHDRVHDLEEADGEPMHASPKLLNGEVDWVYEEELGVRSNYFWSPDASRIAYLQMDESAVPEYPIADWVPTHASVDRQRYPQPGDRNPEVRVGVTGAGGGKTVWVKLPAGEFKPGDDYIPRFGWADRKTLWIETLSRDHQRKTLYFAEAATGRAVAAVEERDDRFFNEGYDVDVANGRIVLTSWADGHTHIYLYSYDQADPLSGPAKLTRQLTQGDFDVEEVLGVDALRQVVYFASNEGNPLDEQLWQVSLAGERRALTAEPGFHAGNFAPGGGTFVDTYSNRMTPPSLSLCHVAVAGQQAGQAPGSGAGSGSNRGALCHRFWSTRAVEAYRLRTPEQLEVKAADGERLYATLLLPEGKHERASVPLILNPYGGPGGMLTRNRWGGDRFLFDQLLAQHGFAVLQADNRGSAGRGRVFSQAAYRNFGPVQFEDQLAVADAALAQHPELDPKRQGWWGWSWGGSFTLYALTHSQRFRAGVAVAPVTDWRDYDTIYTERYLGTPAEFPSGYKDFSVVNSAARLHGHLLLVQGTGDDNVHMQNIVQFIQQLTVNGIPYDLQIYPRKTHSIAGGEVQPHLFGRILAHFEMYLMPPATPEGR